MHSNKNIKKILNILGYIVCVCAICLVTVLYEFDYDIILKIICLTFLTIIIAYNLYYILKKKKYFGIMLLKEILILIICLSTFKFFYINIRGKCFRKSIEYIKIEEKLINSNELKKYKAKYIPGLSIDGISKGSIKKGEIKFYKEEKSETIKYDYIFDNYLIFMYKNQKYYFYYK